MAQRSFAEIRRERERWARPVEVIPKKLTNLASKAGRFTQSRSFLATDRVPDSIFGFPIVSRREDYAESDAAFFREHPEAGGFYDMGEGAPEDGSDEGAPVQDDAPRAKFLKDNPTLFGHVKKWEKLRLDPYEDIGGHAIGYGAHTDAAGRKVTGNTPALADEAAATALLARDLMDRRGRLKSLPGWSRMSGGARQALLDVSMGKDGILSKDGSPGLWRDLRAAGNDRSKLDAAVKKHYVSYLTDDPVHRGGLMNRRTDGMKTFFGEDWSYDGKTWDDTAGFVKKGAK